MLYQFLHGLVPYDTPRVYFVMLMFSPYTLSLTLKPPALIDSIQILSFGRHFSQKKFSLGL